MMNAALQGYSEAGRRGEENFKNVDTICRVLGLVYIYVSCYLHNETLPVGTNTTER